VPPVYECEATLTTGLNLNEELSVHEIRLEQTIVIANNENCEPLSKLEVKLGEETKTFTSVEAFILWNVAA
jgi:hypothetical protein